MGIGLGAALDWLRRSVWSACYPLFPRFSVGESQERILPQAFAYGYQLAAVRPWSHSSGLFNVGSVRVQRKWRGGSKMANTATLRNRLPLFDILFLSDSPGFSGGHQVEGRPKQAAECKVSICSYCCSFYHSLHCRNDIFHQARVRRTLDRLSVILYSLGLASLWLFHLQRLQGDQPRG